MTKTENPRGERPKNIPKLRQLRPPQFEKMVFEAIPGAPKNIECKECGKLFPIPWQEDLPFEYESVQSADGRRWVPVGFPVRCKYCNYKQEFRIETTPFGGYLQFFGDEAFRDDVKGWFACCYSLVSIYPEHVDDAKIEFYNLKRSFLPMRSPDEWILHVKELRNNQSRVRLRRDLSIEEAMDFLRRVVRWIGASGEKFVLASFFSLSKIEYGRHTKFNSLATFRRRCHNMLFHAIYCALTDHVTKDGLTPHYTFESSVRIKDQPFVQEWIERIARGHKFSLLHHYIARGHEMILPSSAEKGDDFRLELADLLAFAVMNNIQRWAIRKDPMIKMEDFGSVFYGAFAGNHLGAKTSVGIPWNFFFGDLKL